MSSLLKKKGGASFKPRAPARRPGATAPPPAPPSAPPSVDPPAQPSVLSVERQLQTSASISIENVPFPSVEPGELTGAEVESTPLPKQSVESIGPTRQKSPVIPRPPEIQAERPQVQQSATIITLEAAAAPPSFLATRPITSEVPIPLQETVTTSVTTSLSRPIPPTISTELPPVAALNTERNREQATEITARIQESILQDGLTTRATVPRLDGEASQVHVAATVRAQTETMDLSVMGAGQAVDPSQIVPVMPLNVDGTSGTPVPIQTGRAKPIARKRKVNEATSDIQPSIETQGPKTKAARTTSAAPRKPRKPRAATVGPPKPRKKRAETPEDAEQQEIDHSKMKMAELCKDLKIGKKFSKHDEIKQRDIDRKAKAKLRRENPELVVDSDDDRRVTRRRSETEQPAQQVPGAGPRMRLVDGQIVIDESSLNLDRHKLAAANAGVMEIVEENEFTRITTSGTFMKREKNIFWDLEAEQKFYIGLRMFGTDFEMISEMFPDRNRRQIKLKFNKEERLYPSKINSALLGERIPINFEEYKAHTGLEYEDVAVINAEREEIEAEQNAEEARVEAELAEATRQKKAAIHASGGLDGKENGGFGGGGSSKPTKKSKKKNKASVFGGGEEMEVLGEI